jgi:hypothetical protein
MQLSKTQVFHSKLHYIGQVSNRSTGSPAGGLNPKQEMSHVRFDRVALDAKYTGEIFPDVECEHMATLFTCQMKATLNERLRTIGKVDVGHVRPFIDGRIICHTLQIMCVAPFEGFQFGLYASVIHDEFRVGIEIEIKKPAPFRERVS